MEHFLLSSIATLAVDRASKGLALRRLGASASVRLAPTITLHLAENRRVGRWGLKPLILLWLVAAAAAIVLLSVLPGAAPDGQGARTLSLMAWGLGLALAGAAGNLVDLYQRGAVIDFIDFDLGGVFNLADLAIWLGTLGATLGLGHIWFERLGGL